MVLITINVFGHSLFATCSSHVVSVKRHVHVLIYQVATHIFQITEFNNNQKLNEISSKLRKMQNNSGSRRSQSIFFSTKRSHFLLYLTSLILYNYNSDANLILEIYFLDSFSCNYTDLTMQDNRTNLEILTLIRLNHKDICNINSKSYSVMSDGHKIQEIINLKSFKFWGGGRGETNQECM